MALSKQERESLGTMIENAVMKGNEPTLKIVNELYQTIHGTKAEPESGLAKRTSKIEKFQKTILYFFTFLTAIGAAFSILLILFNNGILKFH